MNTLAKLIDERRALAAPLSADQQYQRDLSTLDRIEAQRECFFDVMGELRYDQINKTGVESARATA